MLFACIVICHFHSYCCLDAFDGLELMTPFVSRMNQYVGLGNFFLTVHVKSNFLIYMLSSHLIGVPFVNREDTVSGVQFWRLRLLPSLLLLHGDHAWLMICPFLLMQMHRFVVHGMRRSESNPCLWQLAEYKFGHMDQLKCETLLNQINSFLNKEKGRPKSLLVLYSRTFFFGL